MPVKKRLTKDERIIRLTQIAVGLISEIHGYESMNIAHTEDEEEQEPIIEAKAQADYARVQELLGDLGRVKALKQQPTPIKPKRGRPAKARPDVGKALNKALDTLLKEK